MHFYDKKVIIYNILLLFSAGYKIDSKIIDVVKTCKTICLFDYINLLFWFQKNQRNRKKYQRYGTRKARKFRNGIRLKRQENMINWGRQCIFFNSSWGKEEIFYINIHQSFHQSSLSLFSHKRWLWGDINDARTNIAIHRP